MGRRKDSFGEYADLERLVNSLRRRGLFILGTGGGVDFPAKDFPMTSYTVRAKVEGDDSCPERLYDEGSIVFSVIVEDDDEEFYFDGGCLVRYSSVRAAIKALAKMKPAKVDKIVKPFIEKDSKDFIVTCVNQSVKETKDKRGRLVRAIIDKSYEDKTVRALSEEHAKYIVQLQDAYIVEDVREAPKPRKPKAKKSA